MSFISTTDGKDGMRITSEDDGTEYNYCVKRAQKYLTMHLTSQSKIVSI